LSFGDEEEVAAKTVVAMSSRWWRQCHRAGDNESRRWAARRGWAEGRGGHIDDGGGNVVTRGQAVGLSRQQQQQQGEDCGGGQQWQGRGAVQ